MRNPIREEKTTMSLQKKSRSQHRSGNIRRGMGIDPTVGLLDSPHGGRSMGRPALSFGPGRDWKPVRDAV